MFANNALRICQRITAGTNTALVRSINKSATSGAASAPKDAKEAAAAQASGHDSQKLLRLKKTNKRTLSTLQTAVPQAISTTVVSKDESRELMAVFPDIVRDLTDAGRHTDVPEVTRWYAKVLQYNVPYGKKNRGLALVLAYKMLEEKSKLTPENIRLAHILAWCVELLQAFFVVIDDVLDGSEMRRGQPCWYKKEGVGLNAINDGLLLENGIYNLLRRHFSQHPSYPQLMELFHDVTLKTVMGQSLDMHSTKPSKNGKADLSSFTMSRYNSIVKYKTAYYSFQLPVAAAMHLAGKHDPEMHRQAKVVLLEMGEFFQVQDDFLDCFGDPSITGKVGTDIQEGKCSWLAVVALQRARSAQRQIMEDNYGKSGEENVEAIKNLYHELGLPNTFAVYEEESFNMIRTHIQQLSKGMPQNLFFKMMEKIYRREC